MDTAAAFAVIQRALEEFNADVVRAQASQAQSEETIAAVEYEMEQLRKLIAENALETFGKKLVRAAKAEEQRSLDRSPIEQLRNAS
jgi:hypothetical protein